MAKFQKNISLIKSGSIAAPIIKASKHASLDKQKVSTASDKQLAKKKTSIIKKTIKKEFSKDKKAFVKKTKDSSSASENKAIKKVSGEKVPKEKAKKRAISAVKKTLSKKKNFWSIFKRNHLLKNQNYYKTLDGVYQSFWLGKLINMFILKGKKQLASRHIYSALLRLKLEQDLNPVLYLLEILDQSKPLFKLDHWFVGRRMIVYPRIVSSAKRYMVSLRWLRAEILSSYSVSRITTPFSVRVYDKLMELQNARKNSLLKKRDFWNQESVRLQENIRYTWHRR